MTSIEWTERTWNPVRGCSRVSEGCRFCYAERIAARFSKRGMPFEGFAQPVAPRDDLDRVGGRRAGWTRKVALIEAKLEEPLTWRKPSRVFVNSMSDLFHESLSFEDVGNIFSVMQRAKRHTFQVLTKRPLQMLETLEAFEDQLTLDERGGVWPLPNVWLGVSVEDRATLHRIDTLRKVPAVIRFLSLEPLLEDLGTLDLTGINWVIVGGESGPSARPCDVAWIRSAVEQCRAASVPIFVKQVGAKPFERQDAFGDDARGWGDMDLTEAMTQPRPPQMEGWTRIRTETACFWQRRIHLKDRKGGDPDEWPEDLRIREFPR